MKKKCNNRSIITEIADEANNNKNNNSTERQQTTQPNDKKNKNIFSLTEINPQCRNFIFCSSERPTLYSQIQPNKESVNEDYGEYCHVKTIDKTERSDTNNNNNNKIDKLKAKGKNFAFAAS